MSYTSQEIEKAIEVLNAPSNHIRDIRTPDGGKDGRTYSADLVKAFEVAIEVLHEKQMDDRPSCIKKMVDARKEDGETPTPCIFQISVPKIKDGEILSNNTKIKVVTDIFDKYKIPWQSVDTIGGAYNLNRDWIETSDIPCYIEYCGVYPVDWDPEDCAVIENMDYEGEIIVKVLWHVDDEYIPNH